MLELSCLLAPPDANYPIDPGSAWLTKKAAATRALLSGSTELPLFAEVAANAAAGWQSFWSSGAFVDLADAASGRFADPRAEELERRVVLSQYGPLHTKSFAHPFVLAAFHSKFIGEL